MDAVAPGQEGKRRLYLAWAALAVVWVGYAVLTATHALDTTEVSGTAIEGLLYSGLLLCAGLLCFARALGEREERTLWLAFGAGLTVWSFGDIWWIAFLSEASEIPYPSIADGFWLISYPPMAYGLWRLIALRVGWQALGPAAWLDGLIAALAGSAIFAATLLAGPLAAAVEGEPMTFATNLAYPVGDLILLGFALAALSATGWRPGRTIGLIAAGLLLRAVVDFIYLDQVTRGTYGDGGLLDTGWPAASLLVAAAACVRASRSRREPDWRAFLAPAVFVTVSLSLLVYDHFDRLPASAIVLAAVAVAVAALRMVTMVRISLASSRHQAMTDALTGMKNRRSLRRDLKRALEDVEAGRRFAFAMFDLNGFKRYNDTFGHPAGDSLLTRLGRRLEEAAPEGAYRLGGDEFCVLVPEDEHTERLLARSDAALTESGDGFMITASRGSVRIPAETDDPEEAMHLADRRMYAVKLGGRADGDHTVEALTRALNEAKPPSESSLGEMAALGRDVGRRLGLAPEEIDVVIRAAKLHDVGKMAIPDAILSKPGPLDEGEWKYICQHTVIGERIVAAAPPLLPVARLVRSSHERWDGRGYPDGLAGEAIPRGARIVFACDSLDAMMRDRPYRPALTPEQALAELRRCSGTQFDPEVVDAVIAVVEERLGAAAPVA
jgi:diguanylate cyclase (GGDEF)-like protein